MSKSAPGAHRNISGECFGRGKSTRRKEAGTARTLRCRSNRDEYRRSSPDYGKQGVKRKYGPKHFNRSGLPVRRGNAAIKRIERVRIPQSQSALTKPSGDVVLCLLLRWCREKDFRHGKFDQLAQEHECRIIGNAG